MTESAETEVAQHLARNLRQLREARALSQEQLARMAGIPRPTWTNLESGSANPTLAVLVRVAGALAVSIEELIGPPRSAVRHYPAAELPVRRRSGVTLRSLVPDALPGLVVERMELPPGGRMAGAPHTPGTREYLSCESGRIQLSAAGNSWELAPGDVLVFRGDQPHGYRNPGDAEAVAFSVVVLAPG